MAFRIRPEHLKRYADLGWLLIKHGRTDIARQLGLNNVVSEPIDVDVTEIADLPRDLEKLGPTYIKLGQFLSTRADLLPAAYLAVLTRLQDRVDPFSYEQVERIFYDETGMRISKAFRQFDEQPLAAASLSQTHYAVMRDGREVAVKVQRPGIRKQIILDLDAFGEAAEFLEKHTELGQHFQTHAKLIEFRRALLRELDFRQEALNMAHCARNLEDFRLIEIPEPVERFTSSKILTMDFVHGRKVTEIDPTLYHGLDGKTLARELFRAYLTMIMSDGFYHADPHPGNVFLTDHGHIALIDFGQVGFIAPHLKQKLSRILTALGEKDSEGVAQYAIRIGDPRVDFDEKKLLSRVNEFVTRHQYSALQKMQLGRMMLEVIQISNECGINMPNELTMLGKAMLNLDAVGKTLDPEFDPFNEVREYAPQIMRREMARSLNAHGAVNVLLDSKEFVTQLPSRLSKIMELLAGNRLKLHVDAIDERYLMTGFQKIANRLTVGMILAALIVGAALMMRVETNLTVLGYPLIAILFFLVAAITGAVLAFRILFVDERSRRKK